MDSYSHNRSLEDVRRIMTFAKLEESDHLPCIQSIYFSSDMNDHTYKFIEISQSVLQSLEEGSKVVIRGEKADSAVLCTDSETFDIKEQETSNGLLLLPNLVIPNTISKDTDTCVQRQNVVCLNYKYYELREMAPRLKKLQMLLEENPFSGRECEEDEEHQGRKYAHEDILSLVQASEKEIEVQLQKLEACVIDGHWRILDPDFKGKILEHILGLREENGWSWNNFSLSVCCDTLAELYDRSVVENVLKSFSSVNESDMETDSSDEKIYSLSEDKICRFYAEGILRAVNQMNLKEFENVWKLSVPEGLQTSEFQLEGLALITRDTSPESIRYFPENQLPETPAERFNYLFEIREKWTIDEITPYISKLATEKMSTSSLLTKFARASTQNGVKFYNSKRPVS